MLNKKLNTKLKNVLLLIFGVVYIYNVGSCTNTLVDDIERGANYNYRPGFPELRLISSGFVDANNKTKINVAAEIVYGSLVYKKVGDLFKADVSLDFQIVDISEGENLVRSAQFPVEISSERANISIDQSTYLFEREFELPPGDYVITLTLTDQASRKSTVRVSESFVPDLESNIPSITNIRIFAKNSDKEEIFFPITTYDISNEADSVRFVFQVTNNNPESPITIVSNLKRLRSDTSIARPMNYQNYRQGSLPYRGVDYDKFEVVASTRRILTDPGSVLIEFIFTGLERGNYRLEVESETEVEGRKLFKGRDFGVKSQNYPSLKTSRELAAPLYYLMEEREYNKLMSIKNADSLKMEVDRFWLSNIKNSKTARNVISLYYERVEQANKQFSTFKEGWKTDLGMIYILFGPPWYSNELFDRVDWGYSYNSNDPERNFVFYSPRLNSKYFPFQNFLLVRDPRFYNTEYQQVQLWLSGFILKDNL